MDREELKRLTKEEISRRIREGVKAVIEQVLEDLRVLPHSSTPAILRSTRLRMRLWTRRMRFTRATRPQKDRASIR